ncbi:MAG TPA: undecaprenyl-diphosphate phosphatase [Armatimonadota bacterium]
MNILIAIVMGAIQGLTEFLPISSTAHLILAPWLFHWDQAFLASKSFDIALHLGTLVALVVYFWKDIVEVFRAKDWRLLTLVIFGFLPALPAALVEKKIEAMSEPAQNAMAPVIIAMVLIAFAVLLKWADATGRRRRVEKNMGVWDALIIGFGQFIAAAFPGASRSGTTMTFALFRGLTREAAVRFSFLISIPTIAGAVIYSFAKHHHELAGAGAAPLAAGIVSSAVFGYFAVAFLMDFVKRKSMDVFFWYRIAAGIVVLAVYFARR